MSPDPLPDLAELRRLAKLAHEAPGNPERMRPEHAAMFVESTLANLHAAVGAGGITQETTVPGTPYSAVGAASAISTAMTGAQMCAFGWHAWVPWLDTGGSWATWCAREGCDHSEQYDHPCAAGGAPEAPGG